MRSPHELGAIKKASCADRNNRPPRPAVNPDKIPPALQETPNWLLWRYNWSDKNGGKWDKLPLSAHGDASHNGSSTNSATWNSYLNAWQVARCACRPPVYPKGQPARPEAVDGVGFAFANGGGLVGVDIDHCRDPETGELTELGQRIIDRFGTYTEVSPSGTGVKLFGLGSFDGPGRNEHLPDGHGIEAYCREKYFTVTGQHLDGTPTELRDCAGALAWLLNDIIPVKTNKRTPPETTSRPSPLTDDDIIDRVTKRAKNAAKGARLWAGDWTSYKSQSEADSALCVVLTFWCGRDPERIDRLFRRSGLYREEKWERDDYRTKTINDAIALCSEFYDPEHGRKRKSSSGALPPSASPIAPDGRAVVQLDDKEHEAVRAVVAELARRDLLLYQMGGVLVEAVEPPATAKATRPVIVPLTAANIRTRITSTVRLEIYRGEVLGWQPVNPPTWLPVAVKDLNQWDGVRPLVAVTTSPVLRSDGTIHQTPGYDCATGLLYVPLSDFAPIPESPTLDDARTAVELLSAGVREFPWQDTADRSAWLSEVITLAVRHAIDGPCPLYFHTANIRGSGKTSLARASAIIGTGRAPPEAAYPVTTRGRGFVEDAEELRKVGTPVAAEGHPVYLLDNVPSGFAFGSSTLDAIATSTNNSGRQLGATKGPVRESKAVWQLTGNNIRPIGDTVRRSIAVRLFSKRERPDEEGHAGPDVVVWATTERGRLFTAALTVAAAYIRAGRPKQEIRHLGSFEAWSDLVRSALVWCGLPDPCSTREEFVTEDDNTGIVRNLIALLDAAGAKDGTLKTANEIVTAIREELKKAEPATGSTRKKPTLFDLQDAEQYPVGTAYRRLWPAVPQPDSRKLGICLRERKGGIADKTMIVKEGESHGAALWTTRRMEGNMTKNASSADRTASSPEHNADPIDQLQDAEMRGGCHFGEDATRPSSPASSPHETLEKEGDSRETGRMGRMNSTPENTLRAHAHAKGPGGSAFILPILPAA
jgi:primase-polymerase (primpol)-like protein